MYEEIREKLGDEEASKERRALLVAIYRGTDQLPECKEHLDELELLCKTYGIETAEKLPCLVRKFNASTLISSGKVEEIGETAKELGVDVIVFDDEVTPGQQRNLEKIYSIPVIDRSEVIIGVFAQRAHSKEAKLQVELARLKYLAPRLKRMWTHLSRQQATAGGGAYLKGKGEKQIEIDRRLLKTKIFHLQKEINAVQAHRDTQRIQRERSEIPTFAIVGYTNAGKSTLLNALTEAGIFTEDKLFATLDTTTRKFTLPNNQEILLTDTVGFIRKLPHLLVAAFRSTLEEAVQADILIHLIDSSHPMALEQAEATVEVLHELGAKDKPVITVLNKIDRLEDRAILKKLRTKFTKTVNLSALYKQGFDHLTEQMTEELQKRRRVVNLRIPQKDYAVVSEVMRHGNILNQEYEENDVVMRVDLPSRYLGRISRYIEE
ncbi:GTP-binding protein hflX [Waddlia chondrophila 2032/99]|uniref:GTPase HflX n=2 Tax=Waddlia chondrophila TaxID=71667 RepID=D6YWT0_WADCW|nr:GTPase HflX [Waddlia chondrophila]ADI38591.1 GTP-binding protein [Waddlia chondrophila WSU 86-1044]CCB91706.1 GTP-binding protein hflX [Waddlia chondrophila 2032/99]